MKYLFVGADSKNHRLREWRAKNPERVKIHNRRSYARNIEQIDNYRSKRIAFRDRRIILDTNPRSGQCIKCGQMRKTVMHHAKDYFIIFPWFGIEELCRGCHLGEHPDVSVLGGKA